MGTSRRLLHLDPDLRHSQNEVLQFVVWNFIAGAVYVLSVGPAAYGAGKVSSGEQDWGSLGALVAGLALATGCAMLAARYYSRRKARRSPPDVSAHEASGQLP
jgi:membrane protein DedA with SNARE-associated domain